MRPGFCRRSASFPLISATSSCLAPAPGAATSAKRSDLPASRALAGEAGVAGSRGGCRAADRRSDYSSTCASIARATRSRSASPPRARLALDVGLGRRFGESTSASTASAWRAGVEVVNLRVARSVVFRVPELPNARIRARRPLARTSTQVVRTGGRCQEVPLYERDELRAGMEISGYAVVVASTTRRRSFCPGHKANVDPALQPAPPGGEMRDGR